MWAWDTCFWRYGSCRSGGRAGHRTRDELAVNAIKGGKFNLQGGKHWQGALRVCSLLYFAEFLVQLILTPQGTTFGHIIFIVSLCVSWMCSHHFSSFQEKLQVELLFIKLGKPKIRKFHVGTRTAMTVFVCLLLFHDVHHLASSNEYNRILTALLPNATPVWRGWKDRVIKQLHDANDTSLSHLKVNGEDQGLLSETDKKFLQAMLGDAAAGISWLFPALYKSTLSQRILANCYSTIYMTQGVYIWSLFVYSSLKRLPKMNLPSPGSSGSTHSDRRSIRSK